MKRPSRCSRTTACRSHLESASKQEHRESALFKFDFDTGWKFWIHNQIAHNLTDISVREFQMAIDRATAAESILGMRADLRLQGFGV
jgi:hypothetical protein